SRDSAEDTNSIYRVMGLPSDAYVVSARQGDRDILSGDALSSLISDDGPPIEVLVNSQGGVIQGKVTDRRGRIVHNAIVALIPEGSLKQRADKADTYRSTETDQNGEYEFRGVI